MELVCEWEAQGSSRTGRGGMGTKPAAFQELFSPRSWATPCSLGAPSTSPTRGKAVAEVLTCPASEYGSHLLSSVWSAVRPAAETLASSQC